MKVYLVGGAVRDRLLNYPVKENDWVVVGGQPNDLLKKGYKQVGKDFPVFLHPETGEEYALARTERKKGHGYYGFECQFEPNITLEEDLSRRDITINAMAMDDEGKIYDPYGGQSDLTNKVIRHVSPAFKEDPVRVLRVARFLARYHHLGFTLADETRNLMYQMVLNEELDHLVPERIWQEWQKSLMEKDPSVFLLTLRSCGALKALFPELDQLFGIPNPPKYHHEIDTGVHTIKVLDAAVKLTEKPHIRFAAMVHDLGKSATAMAEWPSHIAHEVKGLEIIANLGKRLRIPNLYLELALLVCRYHLNIQQINALNPATIVKILERTNAFRNPERFENILLAVEADVLGREMPISKSAFFDSWRVALEACEEISAKEVVEDGYQGEKIKIELHNRRVNRLQSLLRNKHEK